MPERQTNITHNKKNNQQIETNQEMKQILNLVKKDIWKVTIMVSNMLKNLETSKTFKKTQIKLQEVKTTMFKMKNPLDVINGRLDTA